MAIDDTVSTETSAPITSQARELGGCPVMHEDYSRMRGVGSHWQRADELREGSPVYFNTFAQGYWIFTRHDAVRDIYKTPEIFSSESFTPWEPNPIYRFVPTQIDPPDHIKYRRILNPWFCPTRDRRCRADDASALPRAGREDRARGPLQLRERVRASFPDRGVPRGDRRRHRRCRHVRALGRGFLRRLRRRQREARADGEGARRHPRLLGPGAGGSSRRRFSSAQATLRPICCTPPSTIVR